MQFVKIAKQFCERNRAVLENLSYMSVFQIFMMVAPLITYPYLVKTLGMELYGVVLTAQMLASYATLVVDFGSTSVSARHISVNRDNKEKLAEILNSVLCARAGLCMLCFFLYLIIVYVVPIYRQHYLLFVITYLFTINDVLYPQFFFQGLERIKTITLLNVLTKLAFISTVFFVVKDESDYVLVPLLYGIGYIIGSSIALYIIYFKYKIRFYIPPLKTIIYYFKDCMPIFATDLICVIKDKINYMLVGPFLGMESVVVYDLALKLNNIIGKPQSIIDTVMFPRIAKNKNFRLFKKVTLCTALIVLAIVIASNIFLPWIVDFFLHKQVDLIPIRLMLLAPVILAVSANIATNFFVAFGHNKFILYSILVTTSVYLLIVCVMYFTNNIQSIYSFVIMALIPYMAELVYRIFAARYVIKKDNIK